jgi:osmoprotectant transport system permease protein
MTSASSPVSTNAITVLGAVLGVLSALLPWLLFRPNRLVQGEGLMVWQLPGVTPWAVVAVWVLLGASGFWRSKARGWLGVAALVAVVLLIGFTLAGSSASLVAQAGEFARVSLSGGLWLNVVALYVAAFGVGRDMRWAGVAVLVAIVATFAFGWYARLGPAVEYAAVSDTYGTEVLRHFALAIAATLVATGVGVPLGIFAARNPRLEGAVLGGAGLLQTVPSLALFGLLLAPLAWLGREVSVGAALLFVGAGVLLSALVLRARVPLGVRAPVLLVAAFSFGILLAVLVYNLLSGNLENAAAFVQINQPLSSAGVRGIGAAPALVALVIYALLPVVVNTFVGLKSVPEGVVDAAQGMGMNAAQVLTRAELPIALPAILEGIRGAAVLSFGLTTVAALIGGGGLGFFILRGVDASAPDLILIGAAPIVIIALALDAGLRAASAFVTPKGLA